MFPTKKEGLGVHFYYIDRNIFTEIWKWQRIGSSPIFFIFFYGRTTGIEPARGGFTIHCLGPLGYVRPGKTSQFIYLQSFLLRRKNELTFVRMWVGDSDRGSKQDRWLTPNSQTSCSVVDLYQICDRDEVFRISPGEISRSHLPSPSVLLNVKE